MGVSLKRISDGINKSLSAAVDRANHLESYLNRVVVEEYQIIQRRRWMTENASEGQKWDALNPIYARYKRAAFKAYEGSGTKMLIATGKLFKSVIGPGPGFRKITTPRSLTISTTVDYAPHVDEARTFTTYSRDTIARIRKGIMRYLVRNKTEIPRAY